MTNRLTLFLACLIVGTGTSAFADCRVPHYRKGFVSENSPSGIMINISVAMKDFVPVRLVCLATGLRQRYADRKRPAYLEQGVRSFRVLWGKYSDGVP
jgi:hypothetical protein